MLRGLLDPRPSVSSLWLHGRMHGSDSMIVAVIGTRTAERLNIDGIIDGVIDGNDAHCITLF